MNRSKPKSTAFTLIELLTVVAIIAILVALLFPAVIVAIRKAETAQCKEDEKHIEVAVRNFFTEYGRLPTYSGGTANSDLIYTLVSSNQGANASYFMNPKQIVFLELPNRKGARDSSGNFCDPWGQPYCVVLDTTYVNIVTDPYASKAYTGNCLVISGGPDGNTGTTGDNIVNLTQ